jgi:hypothetical protein
MIPKRVALVVGILVGAGAIAAVLATSVKSAQPIALEIEAPSQWVPFSADIVLTQDADETTGKFFRDGQGSTRHEWSRNNVLQVVSIVNRPLGVTFACNGRGECLTAPLGRYLAPAVPHYRQGTRGLRPQAAPVEGFQVFEHRSPAGQRVLLAPALNFFELEKETTHDNHTRREVYSNVQVGEPRVGLFTVAKERIIREYATLEELGKGLKQILE